MERKTISKDFVVPVPCNFLCLVIELSTIFYCLFKYDGTVLPPVGAVESEAPDVCDVTLSSEGTELTPGCCVVIHYC